jgi:GAF domain-containing protein
MAPTRGSITCRSILDRKIVHVRNMATAPGVSAAVRNLGHKSQISLPLLRDGAAIGAVALSSAEVGGFTDSQVALLQTFAEQAVIAITSAKTYRELQARTRDLEESLEYQTATSDVLQVISRSTFDLQRVLETLAESAATLAQSDTVFIFRHEGEAVRLCAQYAPTPAFAATIGSLTLGADRKSTTGRALLTGDVVRITNVQDEPDYQLAQSEEDRLDDGGAAAARRRDDRSDHARAAQGRTVHRSACRSGAHLCRPGGHRDRECAAAR